MNTGNEGAGRGSRQRRVIADPSVVDWAGLFGAQRKGPHVLAGRRPLGSGRVKDAKAGGVWCRGEGDRRRSGWIHFLVGDNSTPSERVFP